MAKQKKRCNGRLYGGQKEKEAENALVPAHTGKCVDRLLDPRLRLLPLKESLELFLEARTRRVRVSIFRNSKLKRCGGTDLCGVVKAVGHGVGRSKRLTRALQYQAETRPSRSERHAIFSVFSGPRHQ